MTQVTHLFLDFENVKPAAKGIALVRGAHLRLASLDANTRRQFEEVYGAILRNSPLCRSHLLKSKFSSSSFGRLIPCSKYCSQIFAHGRPYMSGVWNSIFVPGATGVGTPFTG